jgi:glutathione S-transferase
MRLRYHAASPFCRKILAMIRYRHDRVELFEVLTHLGDRSMMGYVPMLETLDGAMVDMSEIASHLDGESGLLIPAALRGRVQSMDRLIDLYLMESVVTLRCSPDTSAAELAVATGHRALMMLDVSLEHGPWICGETFTLCDIGAAVGAHEVQAAGLLLPRRVQDHLDRVFTDTVVGDVIAEIERTQAVLSGTRDVLRIAA